MADFTHKDRSSRPAISALMSHWSSPENWPIRPDGVLHPGYTSEEARVFVSSIGRPPLPLTRQEIEEDRLHRPRTNYRSIKWLAMKLGKSLRTVRRYCEHGIIPNAKRSKGETGHWRVSSSRKTVALVRRAIRDFERNRSWSDRRPGTAPALQAWNLNAALEHVDPLAAAGWASKPRHEAKDYDDVITSFTSRKKSLLAAVENEFRAALVTAVCSLKEKESSITISQIAKQMSIPRSTFYRKYPAQEIKALVAQVLTDEMPGPHSKNDPLRR